MKNAIFNKKLTFGTLVVLCAMFFTSCATSYQTRAIDDDIYYSRYDEQIVNTEYQEYVGTEEQNNTDEYDQIQYENEKRKETNRRVFNTIGHVLLWSVCWVEIIF